MNNVAARGTEGAPPPVLAVEGLGFEYRPNAPVFADIGFTLSAGDIFVLLGPNGSGKTTLMDCIAGLLRPRRGRVRLSGDDAAGLSIGEIAKRLGYLPQIQNASFEFTVVDYLVMGRAPYIPFGLSPGKQDYARAMTLLERLGIAQLANKPCGNISGGERQQAQIGRVLMQDTKLILMDEPTNHLDYGNQIRTLQMIATLANEGYTILMTSHMPDHAIMLGCRAGVIDKGGGFTEGAAEHVLSEALLSEIYDTDIRIQYVEDPGRSVCIPGSFGSRIIG